VTLKTGLGDRQYHWKMALFDRAHTTSYWR